MFLLSRLLLRCNSKRQPVRLTSCVNSGYVYLTYISPLKSRHRMALRKYDPRVDRHVIFYQTSIAGHKTRNTPASEHSVKYARLTGKTKNMRPLLARIQRAYDYGRFNPFDKIYNRLVNSRGAVQNRMG